MKVKQTNSQVRAQATWLHGCGDKLCTTSLKTIFVLTVISDNTEAPIDTLAGEIKKSFNIYSIYQTTAWNSKK